MNWLIPAKTFLVGEYIALQGGPAIILTTTPCFKITISQDQNNLTNIHPQSPAGKWWSSQNRQGINLTWHDPYFGCGGLGASSAQFVGVFRAWHDLTNQVFSLDELLNAYHKYSWQEQGARPSGYDVLAQAMHGCVVINQQSIVQPPNLWTFKDLSFILLHTGHKLATHQHLSTLKLSPDLTNLQQIAHSAITALATSDSKQLVQAINNYHHTLLSMDLVATHSVNIIQQLSKDSQILGVKGCGAMGSDTVCVLTHTEHLPLVLDRLFKQSFKILATSDQLHNNIQKIINKKA